MPFLRPPSVQPFRPRPAAGAAALVAALTAWSGAAEAQTQGSTPATAPPPDAAPPLSLRLAPALRPPPTSDAARRLPIFLGADRVAGTPDLETIAEGHVEFRRGGVTLRADRLRYQQEDDLATATGHVRISSGGNVFSGPELQLQMQRFSGWFLSPTYRLARTGAGGSAERIDFSNSEHAIATRADYTGCGIDGSGVPAWLLRADRITIDTASNTGIAEGAQLRFYDVPIFTLPSLSFPLTDERKSGWLPPSLALDSKSGVQYSIPYYWNIAPNRDATFTPQVISRRGPALTSDFRYLEPDYAGELRYDLLPHDRITGSRRYSLAARHDSDFGNGVLLRAQWLRASDDNYWKDFPREIQSSLTPRLLASDLQASRPFGDWTGYARVQKWQVLQTTDIDTRIEAPYEREPQVGARYAGRVGPGLEVGLETEFNRFVSPSNASLAPRPKGDRLHALGSIAWPYITPGWTLTPKLSFNAASYRLDAPFADATATTPGNGTRVVPTLSLDSAWVFERSARFFGMAITQTLEPRVLYVQTPYRDQSHLPNFDAYPKDFNFDSIFTDNVFSGIDRVSDGHQVTAGLTSRFFDPETGAERLRLGIAERYLLSQQRVTPNNQPLTGRLSDLLLLASTTVIPAWTLDTSVQYSPDTNRVNRSVISARWSPGPFRTLSATYRLTRGLSEQVELGWQWPIFGAGPEVTEAARRRAAGSEGGGSCHGTWYGVGRLNYSTFEKRLVDAIAGFEYDAGCWIGRIVASRQSTGYSEATTRLLLQMELVGLSRLGSNPLQTLKDNIPGYRLLREGATTAGPPATPYD